MSWNDAQAYVSWLSRTTRAPYRLPTLEELADAAEGPQPGCHRDRSGREGTCPVGSYGPNDLGLSDLLGNVLEWTSRCVAGDCGRRQLHGGHWANPSNLFLPNTRAYTGRGRRTAFRQHLAGFRVASTAPPWPGATTTASRFQAVGDEPNDSSRLMSIKARGTLLA